MPSGDTFDFINQPILPNTYNRPNQINPQQTYQQQVQNQPQPAPVYTSQSNNNEPEISVGGFSFTTVEEDAPNNRMSIAVDNTPVDVGLKPTKKKRGRKSNDSTDVATTNSSGIIRADGGVEVLDTPTINTYFETATMIKDAMMQIDQVAAEIKAELDSVRQSRTMKSKYNVMTGLAGNISDLLSAKVTAIKELNNCISKSNEMDYRREKDRKEAQSDTGSDDKAIMDMYRAIVGSPQFINNDPSSMAPVPMQQPIPQASSSGIIRGGGVVNDNPNIDQGYLNYMANMTPEFANMLYEQNPDIKQCVVFDASTGAKWFQVMNIKTNQPIPGAPAHDQMFLEDTVLDLKNKVAKNSNINETYPLIVINDHVTAEY